MIQDMKELEKQAPEIEKKKFKNQDYTRKNTKVNKHNG